ncbi:MAG: hypothetical protein F6J86_05095 [Symploca sp. SIO1B1]|nr:hypothetical protein [Symploca sp. SIO1B1]
MNYLKQTSETYKYTRRTFLQTSAITAAGIVVHGCGSKQQEPLVKIFHLPKHFSRRYGEFTANICGAIAKQVKQLKYQLNEGEWLEFVQKGNRVPPPLFTLEIRAENLSPGTNQLKIEATPGRGEPEITNLEFEYDPSPIQLPVTLDWSTIDNRNLEVQDGYWETFAADGGWRVRPKPGFEDYDRLLAVTGAFPGGRRIETDVIFHGHIEGRLYGFGVLPMWGGHPDQVGVSPRRGWNFGIAWYYSDDQGVGMEFGYKYGKDKPTWVSSYRNFDYQEGVRYLLIAECVPELDEDGKHLRYRQRLKCHAAGEPEPDQWMELTDTEGAPLPPGEYAVGLVAHRCQVDFGSVTVTSIEG